MPVSRPSGSIDDAVGVVAVGGVESARPELVALGGRQHPARPDASSGAPTGRRRTRTDPRSSGESIGHIQYSGASGFSTRCQFRHTAASAPCSSDVSTHCPRPVTSRARSAAAMPSVARYVAPMLGHGVRGKTGPGPVRAAHQPVGRVELGLRPGPAADVLHRRAPPAPLVEEQAGPGRDQRRRTPGRVAMVGMVAVAGDAAHDQSGGSSPMRHLRHT